ncbi:MAG: hypothetical protein LBR34_07585, partial [Prevotella sp.]|nr:hypothetical protein [Prevotella sp.]
CAFNLKLATLNLKLFKVSGLRFKISNLKLEIISLPCRNNEPTLTSPPAPVLETRLATSLLVTCNYFSYLCQRSDKLRLGNKNEQVHFVLR